MPCEIKLVPRLLAGPAAMSKPQWPTEDRIDVIGSNGGDGLHYELEWLDRMEVYAEAALVNIREMRREYINRHSLNKGES